MKALAIFYDSLREAIDAKVFYVMVGLSGLIILLTATLTFKPEPPGPLLLNAMTLSLYGDPKDVEAMVRRALEGGGLHGPAKNLYQVGEAATINGAPDGPDSTYQIILAVHCPSVEEAAKLCAQPGTTEQLVRDKFGVLDDLRLCRVTAVGLAKTGGPPTPEQEAVNTVNFDVTMQPTAEARRLWPHEPSLFFGALPLSFMKQAPLGGQLLILEDYIIAGFGAWVSILVSVVITAFFIPNMLRKGTVDLLLVKPIHRTSLLLYKYLGGLLFIFLNTAFVIVGVWAAIGWRSGIWAPSFLLLIFVITFFFAILYAISTVFGVLTRSAIAAILLTCAAWFFLFLVGTLYQLGEAMRQHEERENIAVAQRDSGNWFFTTVNVIHFVLPRTKDLDHLSSVLLKRDLLTANQIKSQKVDDTRIDWGESITVSLVFIALSLGISCAWFAFKDY